MVNDRPSPVQLDRPSLSGPPWSMAGPPVRLDRPSPPSPRGITTGNRASLSGPPWSMTGPLRSGWTDPLHLRLGALPLASGGPLRSTVVNDRPSPVRLDRPSPHSAQVQGLVRLLVLCSVVRNLTIPFSGPLRSAVVNDRPSPVRLDRPSLSGPPWSMAGPLRSGWTDPLQGLVRLLVL